MGKDRLTAYQPHFAKTWSSPYSIQHRVPSETARTFCKMWPSDLLSPFAFRSAGNQSVLPDCWRNGCWKTHKSRLGVIVTLGLRGTRYSRPGHTTGVQSRVEIPHSLIACNNVFRWPSLGVCVWPVNEGLLIDRLKTEMRSHTRNSTGYYREYG